MSDPQSDDAPDNVVTLPTALHAVDPATPPDAPTLENLMAFCQRLEEGMQYVAQTLVAMDSRLRRLELAANKEARDKAKPTILNMHGDKAR